MDLAAEDFKWEPKKKARAKKAPAVAESSAASDSDGSSSSESDSDGSSSSESGAKLAKLILYCSERLHFESGRVQLFN